MLQAEVLHLSRDSSFFHPMDLSWLTNNECLIETWRGLHAIGRAEDETLSRLIQTWKETRISSVHFCLLTWQMQRRLPQRRDTERWGQGMRSGSAHSRAPKVGHN